MVKMASSDHLKYLKVAVEVTRNYHAAAGHGPMIENIYRMLCKIHEQIPEDGAAPPKPQEEPPA